MSYYTTYALLNLKADFRGIDISQMRFGTEPNGKEQLLCFESDPCFSKMLAILGLSVDDLPVLNIQFYKKGYLRNYYPEINEDVPVSDASEMIHDPEAKNHIFIKSLSVIPFQECYTDGSCVPWTRWLGGDTCRYGDFSTMFFAKDAKYHLNRDCGFSKESLDTHLSWMGNFVKDNPNEVAVIFGGIC